VTGIVVGLLAGAVLSCLALLIGPTERIVCGGGHRADQIAQDVSRWLGGSEVDGAGGSYCEVPTTLTWGVIGVLCLGCAIVGSGIGRARR
jgi:hypothetical protein